MALFAKKLVDLLILPSAGVVLGLVSISWQTPLNADELKKSASWNWPEPRIFEEHLLSYLDQNEASAQIRDQAESNWQSDATSIRGPAFLERLMHTAGMIEPRIRDLNLRLRNPEAAPVHPRDLDWLTSDVPGWMQDTIRLACGRAFAQRRMYDEAIETLAGLELVQVCDPASLIFYRATCEHHLLLQKECLANLDLLLEREQELPTRFAQIAQLMKADIATLEEDSLDEVSRLMRDVERRLDLGRAGTRVRDEEQEIVDKLDKLIDEVEQQMQQQKQQSQSGDGSAQQGKANPMEDSQAAGGGGGPGDVDNKELGERAEWGNLPPAKRKESLQRLTEDLPSHYRDVIEGYFRQLAKDRK